MVLYEGQFQVAYFLVLQKDYFLFWPFCSKFHRHYVLINCFKESSPRSQIKNISSIYLHHVHGCCLMSFKIPSLRSVMNIIVHGEANVLPIAVTLVCFKVFSLNWKMLLFKTIKFQLSHFSPSLHLRTFSVRSGFPHVAC